MSIRWRLALLLAGVVFATVTSMASASWLSASRELHDGVDQELLDRVARLDRSSELIGRFGPRGPQFGPLIEPDTIVQISAEGSVLLHTGGAELPLPDGTESANPRLDTLSTDAGAFRVVTVALDDGVYLQVARSLDEITTALAGLRRRLLGLTLVGSGVAALIGWLVARSTVAPIEQLSDAAQRVAATEELEHHISVERDDEVGRLASSFNAMMKALHGSREQQRRFVSDAGHELRTPITSVKTNLEVHKRRPDLEPEAHAVLVDSALAEIDELTVMVDELVSLSTAAERSTEQLETATLDSLVAPVVDRHRRRTGRPIEVHGIGSPVSVRPTQFERALGNLLDNAHKWSPDGTTVEVIVDATTLTVRDRGPGIPEESLPRVFERFHRADSARSMPGSGLGLAIVRQAVEANGGTVFARNHAEGGAEVGFTLPAIGPLRP